jgi:hypothetical protein
VDRGSRDPGGIASRLIDRPAPGRAAGRGCRGFAVDDPGLLATDRVVPHAEIESALERAEHLVGSIEGRALSPRILELRGRLAAAVRDARSSDPRLREAHDLYRAIGATGHAERLARELDA